MTKPLRYLSALGAVLFALVGLAACGSSSNSVPSNAVVSVNGTPISNEAFKHWMTVAAVSSAGAAVVAKHPVAPVPPEYTACIAHLKEIASIEHAGKRLATIPPVSRMKTACEQQYKTLSQEVLGFLLSSQWVISEAESLGVKVSDAEVKKQFEKIRSQQFPKAAEFEKFLASSGQTVSDLLLRVKLNMLSQKIQQKIVKSKVNVSQSAIEKYFNENKSHYGTAEKRAVQIILTHTQEQALNAKKEIESGKSFASVAQKDSVDAASKKNGGKIAEVTPGQEPEPLGQALFTASVGPVGGPISTAFGYYIYQVLTITPATHQSLSAVQASIKQQLTASEQQKALSEFVKNFKAKWTAKTNCRTGYVVADCQQYKAPTGTTSTGTTTPGG